MITTERSTTGRPLMVGGPQIGYFYPGLTYEIDMHAGDLQWRGATSAPFPGYLLIGRGEDFANTLTSASGDIIDQYVETLCDGSDTKYLYKGECREMGNFDAGTLDGEPVTLPDHRPRPGGRLRDRRRQAGRDLAEALELRQGHARPALQPPPLQRPGRQPEDASSRPPRKTPQTFNSFYIDNEHIAEYTSGKLPLRHPDVDPGLLTNGTGKYEWQGFLAKARPSAGHRPQGRDDHQLEPDRRQGLRRGRRRVGPQRLGRPHRPARQEPRPPRQQAGQVVARDA